jgi:MoxR-like ATPase
MLPTAQKSLSSFILAPRRKEQVAQTDQLTQSPQAAALQSKAKELLHNINTVMVGIERAVRLTVYAFFAGGHVLIEDVPGVGKTLLAKSLAMSIRGSFKRIQCTPDLLPSDVSGISIYQQHEGTFKFSPGPIFTNILLADEINRATPRTQSALLEAMEEQQVTTDGVTRPLPELFFVIATENPIEYHGTFPLPEAQLDRFMISLSLGYPEADGEIEILDKTLVEGAFSVEPVLSIEDVLSARAAARGVFVEKSVKQYIVDIVNATRSHEQIALGVSPRGSQLLMRAAQAAAFVDGRNFVRPEDVKFLAPFILGHRIIPSMSDTRDSHSQIIERLLQNVPVPV